MKKLIVVAVLLVAANAKSATGTANLPEPAWKGKFSVKNLPSPAAYQSLYSNVQTLGIQWDNFELDKGGQPLFKLGLYLGAYKPILSNPGDSPRLLGGTTIIVPGSNLDWALGTNWGAKWLPSLKTGMMAGYDLLAPSALHVKPTFIGVGVNYQFAAQNLGSVL